MDIFLHVLQLVGIMLGVALLYVFSLMLNKALILSLFDVKSNLYLIFCIMPVLNMLLSVLFIAYFTYAFFSGIFKEEVDRYRQLKRSANKVKRTTFDENVTRYLINK